MAAASRARDADGMTQFGDTVDPEDVQHWIAVYEELLRTVPPLGPGDDGHGLPRAHAVRWQGRLDFWSQRVRQ